MISRRDEVDRLTNRSAYAMRQRLGRAGDQIHHARAQVVALSPQKTLDRGYAVIQHPDGDLVMSRGDVTAGDLLKVTVSDGAFAAQPVLEAPRAARGTKPGAKTPPGRRTAKRPQPPTKKPHAAAGAEAHPPNGDASTDDTPDPTLDD